MPPKSFGLAAGSIAPPNMPPGPRPGPPIIGPRGAAASEAARRGRDRPARPPVAGSAGLARAAHATSASLSCEKTISRYVSHVSSSSRWVPMPTTVPASMTTIRSACMIVPTRWATMITVAERVSSRSAARSCESVLKSSAEKLSSNR